MESTYSMKVIARIHSEFPDKFGIPRQSGLINTLKATIVFEPEYRNPDAFRSLADFTHIWLIWGFSESVRPSWSPTVRPPRLGGNTRLGVFATRSPYRPNPIGLSSVQLDRVEIHPEYGPVLHISGADLMDQTPIFDIKPYLPYVDSHPEASEGFGGPLKMNKLEVHCPEEYLSRLSDNFRESILALLAQDPRPSYQDDPERIYGLRFAGYEVKFRVEHSILYVCSIEKEN
ncbi:MAG: tRNA (N6-threonylcarbamoyladenosine(37)-N6)-methyltransferase TrmO [Clostridia bacterium]|nr:tRNA (N6-threonylcarbamoyladenosine(37)-N6)-methyltransferase TrmO [Lachnospiraceae bacterium]NCC01504.1 tRNA (N6-threonylcarbamoyladenosine(37)-N6)-methyltransferase TrmO [Clostridia bacterium]NCD03349.1 tRNA (N6-threonylcarbamoyladenosine(37)-N6)-methyltransferase TrmO [Clostridia bacterium]